MRWPAKPWPQEGDRRRRQRFALLPVRVSGVWVWLERVVRVEVYDCRRDEWGDVSGWIFERWEMP